MRNFDVGIPAVSRPTAGLRIFTAESENLFYDCVWTAFLSACIHAQKDDTEGSGVWAAAETQPEFVFKDIEGTLVCVV